MRGQGRENEALDGQTQTAAGRRLLWPHLADETTVRIVGNGSAVYVIAARYLAVIFLGLALLSALMGLSGQSVVVLALGGVFALVGLAYLLRAVCFGAQPVFLILNREKQEILLSHRSPMGLSRVKFRIFPADRIDLHAAPEGLHVAPDHSLSLADEDYKTWQAGMMSGPADGEKMAAWLRDWLRYDASLDTGSEEEAKEYAAIVRGKPLPAAVEDWMRPASAGDRRGEEKSDALSVNPPDLSRGPALRPPRRAEIRRPSGSA